MKKLIVFTDLDGSLLNHETYSWKQAIPAIQELNRHAYPMVINSSKTSSEIKRIREKMHNTDPFICENGSVVHLNKNMRETPLEKLSEIYFSKPYDFIIKIMKKLKKVYRFNMLGFHDMTIQDLMEYTDLDEICASAAIQREASEPLIWNDTEESLILFKTLLHKEGLTLTKGGRFYHIMSPVSKGESINYLIKKYQQIEPQTQWFTAGLGDSFNDISMLEQVDYPVLIKNPHGNKPDVSHLKNIQVSELPGPAGWNVEVLNIINTITGI